MTAPATTLVLGTRSSTLALWQTELVAGLLRERWPGLTVELHRFDTLGDVELGAPIPSLPENAFTDQLERALLAGTIDVAVHSYKDLPFTEVAGLTIAAVPVRADVREALVSRAGCTLAELPQGATLGTSSERRAAYLKRVRPDLELRPLRGAVDDRLRQVLRGDFDAALFAVAGLDRLGLAHHISEYFSADVMPPAAGQGALAMQCRGDDANTIALLQGIDDPALHATVRAERMRETGDRDAQSRQAAHP